LIQRSGEPKSEHAWNGAELVKLINEPAMRAKLESMGLIAVANTRRSFGRCTTRGSMWWGVVRRRGYSRSDPHPSPFFAPVGR
jgi:hypothetical protein